MKFADSWFWPDNEHHLLEWIASPKGRMIINNRPAYQGKKQLRCMDFIPADRRRVMIDVGGHIGLWSYNFMHWFEHVQAFEPVAAHRLCFVRNIPEDEWIAASGIDRPEQVHEGKRVTLYPYALGDREGSVSIHTSDTSSGDSWVKGKGTIPMKTIDSFNFVDVDFIKIDCEGYEEFVLRGAAQTIAGFKPLICVEQKRDMASSRFGLKPLGAVKYLIDNHGYKVVADISGDYIMQAAA